MGVVIVAENVSRDIGRSRAGVEELDPIAWSSIVGFDLVDLDEIAAIVGRALAGSCCGGEFTGAVGAAAVGSSGVGRPAVGLDQDACRIEQTDRIRCAETESEMRLLDHKVPAR